METAKIKVKTSFSTITLASGHGKDSYRRVAQHLLAHILPTKETTAYITFSTLRPNETVKISPSKSGDSADMAETQPQMFSYQKEETSYYYYKKREHC
ncbi:hypothetical protein TNCT_35431 [Trichonephila clavata]|uniref:Uncharacterized protein n=1 Tax=Trichonephila clavata TaxID=2740835 RepID=A0A8X6LCL3_TRICU|nr:hypothetical protein TNCT_35431 [Trichonephila clavata]